MISDAEDTHFVTTLTTDRTARVERPIDWLIDVLRGANPEVIVSRRNAPKSHVELERYTVFPSESDPRLIVTSSSNRVRSATLRRIGSQSSPTMKLARRVGGGLARVGLDQLATGPDVVLSIDAAAVEAAPGDRVAVTLVEYLESALQIPGLHIAVMNGPLRPNRKPVLQVMDADGRLISFAKIGWDPSTRNMVATEAAVLEELQELKFDNIVTPRIMHFGTWRDLAVLATEPLDDLGDGVPDHNLVDVALREMARHRGTVGLALGASGWLQDVVARSRALVRPDNDLGRAVTEVCRVHGATELTFGFSHGDWSPWNMAPLGEKLGVWDWERASTEVPLGLDLVHFHFQQAFHANGQSVRDALDYSHDAVTESLAHQLIEPVTAHLLTLLYVLELALRYSESSLASETNLDRIRQDLIASVHSRLEDPKPTPAKAPQAASGGRSPFTRRMLGGSGVPAPIRNSVKTTVKAWGRATAGRRVLPNTFIVGGQRCGTTSLFRYLTQHASVTGPRLEKGVHYFDTNYTNDLDWYRSHFPTVRSARLSRQRNGCDLRVLEAAPYYLFHPLVASRIAEVAPDAKIIAVLRDPVGRALSHHNHEVKRGFELETFGRAIELENERLEGEIEKLAADPGYISYEHQHHSYVARGRYEEQLERYDSLFGAENVLVLRAVDLESNSATTIEAALAFLGIPVVGTIKFPRFNARKYQAMDADIESQLRTVFASTDAAMAERFGRNDPWT